MSPELLQAINWVFSDPRERIQQNEWELREFLQSVEETLQPKRTVELGTWRGVTATLLSLATSQVTVTLDIDNYGSVATPFAPRNLERLLRNARKQETVDEIRFMLGGPIDLLFVDDGHRIEEVTEEYALWKNLVRPGGWIAFHDINPNANQCAPGVHPDICQAHAFWATLPEPKREIIWTGEPPGPGIGVIVK